MLSKLLSLFRPAPSEEGEPAESTLVLIKPDGIVKSLTGNILSRLSEAHLRIMGAKVLHVSRELAEAHYAEHRGKPFFQDMIDYLQGKMYGPEYERVMALVYEGVDAIQKVRSLAGSTNPEEADASTIRGAFGRITTQGVYENVIHSSADKNSAEREIKLWFSPGEIVKKLYPCKKVIREAKEETVWV